MTNTPEQERPLNIVGRITAYFVNSQVTILIIVALVIFGLAAAFFTAKEENPQIDVPGADVYFNYPGAPAQVVEETVTVQMEGKIRELPGIDDIYSVSETGEARLTVQFEVGENWENSLFRLQNHLFSWQDRLPSGVDYLVKPLIVDDVSIVTLTLAGDNYSDNQLHRVGQHILRELRKIPNTGNLTIAGGQPRVVRVDLDPEQLAAYEISPSAIAETLEEANNRVQAEDVAVGNRRIYIEGGNLLESAAELEALVVGEGEDNSPIYLGDVARVWDDYADRETYSRLLNRQDWEVSNPYPDPKLRAEEEFEERPAITIGIAKKEGTNAVVVAEEIFDRVEELKSDLPDDIEIAVSRNDGRSAAREVGDLYTSLFQSIAIVVVLLVAFLGWQEALIVALAIPLTLAGTLLVGWIAGQTINRITLFALILSLGILVDDAIAVTENIHRRFEEMSEQSFSEKVELAILAVAELGVPILLSTITVILAFIPMGFVTGMMGPYMRPIPFNVPVAMVISTALAIIVTPYLAVRVIKVQRRSTANNNDGHSNEEVPNRIYRLYRRIMEPLLDSATRRRFLIFFVTGLLLASFALPLTQAVKFRMLPKGNENTFLVELDAPKGTELNETNRIVKELESVLQEDSEIVQFESYVGTGAPFDFNGLFRSVGKPERDEEHLADIRVHLTNENARSVTSEDVVFRLRPKLTKIAQDNNAIVKLIEDPPGPPVRSTMLAEIYGPDYDRQRDLAKEVASVFRDTGQVVDIDESTKNLIPQMTLEVDRQRTSEAGLSTEEVAQTINMAIAGVDASTLQVPGELTPVDIQVRFAEVNRQSIDDLRRIQLPTPEGDLVPLTELVSFNSTTVDQPIFHRNQQPVSYVFAEMGDRSSVYAVIEQMIYFFRNPLPEGYSIRWDGEWDLTLEVFRDLGLAMLVAVILIYIILVGQFRSFKIPLIMLGSIPLALIGILVGFSLNGVYFSATGMIGVIALAGIVVRNAIVLLEFISDRRKEGIELKEAVIEAGAVRFRPILLTSITTMLGTLTILRDPVWSGLAWTLLTGMLTSSALTLFIIPLMYYGDQRSNGKQEPESVNEKELVADN
ncbi:MAG: efflux RND transporter permease subunit [Halothece sp.]